MQELSAQREATIPSKEKQLGRLFCDQQYLHAWPSPAWGSHRVTTKVGRRESWREVRRREKSRGKEGHLSLDAISLQGTPALLKHVLNIHRTLCSVLGFLILFEGRQNNAMCSPLVSSAESFKYMFLPPRSFLISTSSKSAGPAKGTHRTHCSSWSYSGSLNWLWCMFGICRASSTSLWSEKPEVLHVCALRQCSPVVKDLCSGRTLSLKSNPTQPCLFTLLESNICVLKGRSP